MSSPGGMAPLALVRVAQIKGNSLPPMPSDGAMFSLAGEMFTYWASINKWLSVRTFRYNAAVAINLINSYMNFPGGLAMSSTLGWKLPYDMTLVSVDAWKNDAVNDPTFEVRVGGSAKYSTQIGASTLTATNDAVRVDFSANDIIGFGITGTALLGCGMCGTFRRRMAPAS